MLGRLVLVLAISMAGCKADSDSAPAPPPAPAGAEEQLRAALRGQPDEQGRTIAAEVTNALSADERAALGQIDYAQVSGSDLLRAAHFMRGWGVVAIELLGVAPRHAIDHPPCTDVEEVLEGWSVAAGSILREEIGGSVAGDHAPAVVLFLSKKTAQTWRVTIDRSFEHASHCAATYATDGGTCGSPGAPCCDGTCGEGATCVGGLCL